MPGEYINHTKSEPIQTDDDLVENFKELLPKFKLQPYNPKDFPNPTMNYFYKVAKHEILQIDFTPQDKILLKNDITIKKLQEVKQSISNDESSIEILKRLI